MLTTALHQGSLRVATASDSEFSTALADSSGFSYLLLPPTFPGHLSIAPARHQARHVPMRLSLWRLMDRPEALSTTALYLYRLLPSCLSCRR